MPARAVQVVDRPDTHLWINIGEAVDETVATHRARTSWAARPSSHQPDHVAGTNPIQLCRDETMDAAPNPCVTMSGRVGLGRAVGCRPQCSELDGTGRPAELIQTALVCHSAAGGMTPLL
jgi:hypothetical protein